MPAQDDRRPALEPQTVPAGRASQPKVLLALLLLGVAGIVAAAHWPALDARAICVDDDMYLTRNPLVQHPSWSNAGRFLSEVRKPSTVAGYYQPLTMISLMLDSAMGGRPDALRPYHRTSLALHAANSALLALLLYLLFGDPLVAALVGLSFGLHPLTVELIPWVSERKSLLAGCFALGALVLYVRYARRPSVAGYLAVAAAYVLALLGKPTATPLPLCMLLLDWWPLGRLNRRAFWEKMPLLILSAVFGFVTVLSQSEAAGVVLPGEVAPRLQVPLVLCRNLIFYLGKIVWPAGLSPHYPMPEQLGVRDPDVLIGLLLTPVLLVLLLGSLRSTRAWASGFIIFFLMVLPTMGIIGFTLVIAADNYIYLPMAGLLLPVAWSLARRGISRFRPALALLLIILAGEAAATRHYLRFWSDTPSIYQRMLQIAPQAPLPHYNLGVTLVERDRLDEAIGHFRAALAAKPDHVDAMNRLSIGLAQRRQLTEAIRYGRAAVTQRPSSAEFHSNLGGLLQQQGDWRAALTAFRNAVRLDPAFTEAHTNLGNLLATHGQQAEAVGCFQTALRLRPDDPDVHNGLGIALAQQGQLEQAIAQFREALRLEPEFETARSNLLRAEFDLQRRRQAPASHPASSPPEPGP